jgi:hypothetical protein
VTKHLITVCRGRTNLHTFGKLVEADHLPWMPETHASRKQLKQRQTPHSPLGVASWPPPTRRELGTPLYEPLGDTVHLAPGVDVSKAVLTVILDALRSDERHKLDLGDLKVVVSELGSRIAQLGSLAGLRRQHAETALHRLILERSISL